MGELKKDLIVGGLFVGGISGFISGAFVLSSALFATIAVVNTVHYSFKPTTDEGVA